MRRVRPLADERGTTLVEALVGLAAGGVILAAVSTVLIVSVHGSDRISARVDANQRARIAMNKIIDQLHSACVAPQIAPIQKESSGTLLSFIHQTGSAVALTPVLSKISLVNGTLTQSDYPAVSGSPPLWTYATNPSSTTQLMTKISATAPNSSIFSYYTYSGGQVSATPLMVPLDQERAASAIKVAVAFTAAPMSAPVGDKEAAASVQSSAVLRLTPPSFTTGANAPCQ